MILDTTHHNKDHATIINDLVGKPYSFMQSLRIGGTGSGRMIIDEVSPNFMQYVNGIADITYGNIELRPHGILLRISKGLMNYTWIIPFYQLYVFKTDGISIHGQGSFVHFKRNKMYLANKKFFDKMMDFRVDDTVDHYFI
jgi:hypothetical protein